MDFQFNRDPISHQPIAKLSMEQEPLGNWLTDEIGTDQVLLVNILRHAEQVRDGSLAEWHYIGHESSLLLQDGAAEVSLNLSDGEGLFNDPALELAGWNAVTDCGIEDFLHLLRSWQEYILS
jgi:uncharacterized protein YacL (UPF0231 family)